MDEEPEMMHWPQDPVDIDAQAEAEAAVERVMQNLEMVLDRWADIERQVDLVPDAKLYAAGCCVGLRIAMADLGEAFPALWTAEREAARR